MVSGVMAGFAKKPEDRPKTCVSVLTGGSFNAETQNGGEAAPVGNVIRAESAKPEKLAETASRSGDVAAEKKEWPMSVWLILISVLLFLLCHDGIAFIDFEMLWNKFRAYVQDNPSILTGFHRVNCVRVIA